MLIYTDDMLEIPPSDTSFAHGDIYLTIDDRSIDTI
jgi:hypothetical protein